MEKVLGSSLDLSTKILFTLDKYPLKIWVENYVLLHVFNIRGNRKRFFGCFTPIDQANPFVYSFSFTLHTSYRIGMLDQKRLSKCSKTNYFKSSVVTNFAQTCSLIPIYIGMYTVCSYDNHQRTGQTG